MTRQCDSSGFSTRTTVVGENQCFVVQRIGAVVSANANGDCYHKTVRATFAIHRISISWCALRCTNGGEL